MPRWYETAIARARDVERFLHDDPVSAGPPSVTYRVRKFTRPNLASVITARTDHQIEERIAKTRALAPDSVSDFSRVQRLADRSVKGTEAVAMRRYFVLAKAMTDLRAGRHQQAIEWLGRHAPRRDGVHLDGLGLVVLPIAQQGLGQDNEARSS